MAKLTNDTNQVESPVDIAMQMLAGTQDIIFNSILGPQQPQRVDKIAGEVIDFDTIIQDTIVQGKLMQEEKIDVISIYGPDELELSKDFPGHKFESLNLEYDKKIRFSTRPFSLTKTAII